MRLDTKVLQAFAISHVTHYQQVIILEYFFVVRTYPS